MKNRQFMRLAVDALMTVALLLLMAYSLVGEAAHEWLGAGICVLFILHHILNIHWSRSMFKGRYTTFRTVQTVLVVLVFLTMAGCMVSGVILSRRVFVFLRPMRGQSWARVMHLLCSYWGFVFLSLHLGLHWGTMAKKFPEWTKPVGLLAAAYGLIAFFRRHIWRYMFLVDQFVFYDFDEPRIIFFLDYLAVMSLFVCIGHYLAKWVRGVWLPPDQNERE